jgi:dTDP-4-amino-4,6-dideoxygalactose transaminase
MKYLHNKGIATRPGTHAVHSLDFYSRSFGWTDEQLPNSALCRDTTIALPLHNKLKNEDIYRVIDAIQTFV